MILRPDFDKYRRVSGQIQDIFRTFTNIIEPLSLDEAFLDVSESPLHANSATRIAETIRRKVRDTLNITVSAGVAPNKFLAKVASDWNKPDGLFVIPPDRVDAFVAALPVNRISGVGRVTGEKLAALGIHTCGDQGPGGTCQTRRTCRKACDREGRPGCSRGARRAGRETCGDRAEGP